MFGFCNMIEGGRKKLLTQLLTSDYKFPGITYTQSGNLTYFDSTGTLKTAGVDTMVLDYDPSTLVLRGYPFWEQRTNSCLQSEDFATTWAIGGTGTPTVTTNTTVAPDGNQTADTLTGNDGTNSNRWSQAITLGNSTTYTYSLFVKNSTALQTFIRIITAGANNTSMFLNWTGATLTSQAVGGTITPTVSKTSLNNGWYRVTLTFTSGGADAGSATLQIYPEEGTVNKSLIVWGSMFETGAFVTPYIKTTTAAVTRAAPSCAITGSNFTSFWNATQGTMLCTAIPADTSSAQERAIAADDGTTNNYLDISRVGTSAQVRMVVANGGVPQFNNIVDSWPILTKYKAALSYQAANFAACLNGGTVVTKASGTIPTVTTFRIGNLNGGNFWNGWVQTASYYGSALPNSIKSLTT